MWLTVFNTYEGNKILMEMPENSRALKRSSSTIFALTLEFLSSKILKSMAVILHFVKFKASKSKIKKEKTYLFIVVFIQVGEAKSYLLKHPEILGSCHLHPLIKDMVLYQIILCFHLILCYTTRKLTGSQ